MRFADYAGSRCWNLSTGRLCSTQEVALSSPFRIMTYEPTLAFIDISSVFPSVAIQILFKPNQTSRPPVVFLYHYCRCLPPLLLAAPPAGDLAEPQTDQEAAHTALDVNGCGDAPAEVTQAPRPALASAVPLERRGNERSVGQAAHKHAGTLRTRLLVQTGPCYIAMLASLRDPALPAARFRPVPSLPFLPTPALALLLARLSPPPPTPPKTPSPATTAGS